MGTEKPALEYAGASANQVRGVNVRCSGLDATHQIARDESRTDARALRDRGGPKEIWMLSSPGEHPLPP